MSDLPRCGDVVQHGPTGERWIVAWAESEHLAPAGYPSCRAQLADCTILRRCTDEEHAHAVQLWRNSTGSGDDGRRARVLRLYGAAADG